MAGIIGAILMFVIFDWALIIISSVNGATTLVGALTSAGIVPALNGALGVIAVIVLVLIGIGFQAQQLRQE